MSYPNTLLEVKDLKVHFPIRGGVFLRTKAHCKAVDGVSFKLHKGKTLGLVGESGCGKTTLAKTIVQLIKPTSGNILFQGSNIPEISKKQLGPYKRNLQMIFQDPAESLNSRHTIGEILEEPLIVHKIGTSKTRKKKVAELLERVGISERISTNYPFEFSGGQRQRISVARALILNPKLIICDEAVSALDVSVQGQILNLLLELQKDLGLAYLFISHELNVVKHVSDHLAVMYLGKIVEQGPAQTIYESPRHPYTHALIEAIPQPSSHKAPPRPLKGDIPSPINPPTGCPFHTRCAFAKDKCREEAPKLRSIGPKVTAPHVIACHFDL